MRKAQPNSHAGIEEPWQARIVHWTSAIFIIGGIPLLLAIAFLAGKLSPLIIIDFAAITPVIFSLILRLSWRLKAAFLIAALSVICLAGVAINGHKFGSMMIGVLSSGLCSALFGWRIGAGTAAGMTLGMILEGVLTTHGFLSPPPNELPGESFLSAWLRATVPFGVTSATLVAAFASIVRALEHRQSVIGGLNDELTQQIEERERLIKDLEEKNSDLERFTYMVSHDLRSPLVTIKVFMGMLRHELAGHTKPDAEEHFRRVSDAADRMGELLDDLLELSRIGRVEGERRQVPMNQMVQAALDSLEGTIRQNRVWVEVEEMPSVFVDEGRIIEVWQNLIENAVKYMGNQERPQIHIGSRSPDGTHEFFVADNGMGIDLRYAEKIFEPFEKLDPGSKGSGIGLSIVQKIVDQHGGRIWLESPPGQSGSIFRFTLPIE